MFNTVFEKLISNAKELDVAKFGMTLIALVTIAAIVKGDASPLSK